MVNEPVLLTLQRAAHATLQELSVRLVGLDLTASELNALGNLADGAPRTVSELGAAVGSRPTTLTGVLDRLQRRGLISRAPRPGDRRAVQIALTEDGRPVATTVRAVMVDVEREALAALSTGAVDAARAVLVALAGATR